MRFPPVSGRLRFLPMRRRRSDGAELVFQTSAISWGRHSQGARHCCPVSACTGLVAELQQREVPRQRVRVVLIQLHGTTLQALNHHLFSLAGEASTMLAHMGGDAHLA